MNTNIMIILGTRPEIIKMSPIIRACQEKTSNFSILHTGQHYSYTMDTIFFDDLSLPRPKYNLDVGSGLHGEQTGKMLAGIEKVLIKENPSIVLVQGDTNTVLAGALATAKISIKLGHVEAGLRSFDRTMPEEINRIVADHISDFLFTPTLSATKLLLKEGIPKEKIFCTGNTIVDAVYQNLEIAQLKGDALKRLKLEPKKYMLLTTHRQENVDVKKNLKDILGGMELIYEKYQLPIIFPIHPRTFKKVQEFMLEFPRGTLIIEPLGYLEFLQLEANAKLVLTDSGGLQEESCVLGVPCVTLRENTERPETIDVGSNMLSGCQPERILVATNRMIKKSKWINPFGSGNAGREILRIIESI